MYMAFKEKRMFRESSFGVDTSNFLFNMFSTDFAHELILDLYNSTFTVLPGKAQNFQFAFLALRRMCSVSHTLSRCNNRPDVWHTIATALPCPAKPFKHVYVYTCPSFRQRLGSKAPRSCQETALDRLRQITVICAMYFCFNSLSAIKCTLGAVYQRTDGLYFRIVEVLVK